MSHVNPQTGWAKTQEVTDLQDGTLKVKIGQCYVLIDKEDRHLLDGLHWYTRQHHRTMYAHGRVIGTSKTKRLHRLVMKAKQREIVDHINGNGLDNRKSNLRIVTASKNAANRANCVEEKGYETLPNGGFRARIGLGLKDINLGTYRTEAEASAAYRAAYLLRLHIEN